MGYKSSSLSCLALLLAFSSCIHAFDVLKVFGSDPEFTQFIKALTETKLVDEINKRSTITVLSLNNEAMSSLSGKSTSTLKDILSTHLLLDFYDDKALFYANTNHTKMPTLFQSSGKAVNDQGYIYVSLINEGEIAFASAVNNAPYKSLLVKTVGSEPSTISVLEVSAPIVAPGIESTVTPVVSIAPVPSAPKATATAKAPATGTEKAPATSNATAKAPATSTVTAKAPAPAKTTVTAKAPVAAPVATSKQGPAPAEVSVIAAPAPSNIAEPPVDAAAPSPVAEEAAAPAPHSSASSTQIGLVGAVMAMASLFVSL
ncbi:PREDICTED: fasciclin-like arabinogalactan protein 3 isoform X2 [Lupinus angustifolius]|uniref:fasciclin-like arabinogalactan protein 3 isoform X2 n=1 Tax=Lupinus angustifolius TaxID=3871 RepID=UPI00092F82A2|nr:PREDICTED: fasciclin-like arabinogalactan protein 3 isoform X2 [Lupinus angustifolius]